MKSRQPRLSMKEHAKGPEGASLSEEYGSKVPQDAAALYRAIRGFEEKAFFKSAEAAYFSFASESV